jgi:hypothetical protein
MKNIHSDVHTVAVVLCRGRGYRLLVSIEIQLYDLFVLHDTSIALHQYTQQKIDLVAWFRKKI